MSRTSGISTGSILTVIMMRIDLALLYEKQAELDEVIARKRDITYAVTKEERLLAFLVELGELANATRCFKYWSGKGPMAPSVIAEEYADGLHFLLSLGIPLKVQKTVYDVTGSSFSITHQILDLFSLAHDFRLCPDEKTYVSLLQAFLALGLALGLDEEKIRSAYERKRAINLIRQKEDY